MEKLVTIKDLERNVTRVSTFLDVLYRDEENNQELIELAKSRLQTNLDTIQIEQAVRQSLVTEFANQIKMDTCTFTGDIVICDARTVFDTTSCLSHWEDEAQSLGLTTCLISPPLGRNFCCEFLEMATNRKLGNFCTRQGQIGVFLVDEVLHCNPKFKRQLKNPYFTTVINAFKGEISLNCCAPQDYISIIGSGNRNFYSKKAAN